MKAKSRQERPIEEDRLDESHDPEPTERERPAARPARGGAASEGGLVRYDPLRSYMAEVAHHPVDRPLRRRRRRLCPQHSRQNE